MVEHLEKRCPSCIYKVFELYLCYSMIVDGSVAVFSNHVFEKKSYRYLLLLLRRQSIHHNTIFPGKLVSTILNTQVKGYLTDYKCNLLSYRPLIICYNDCYFLQGYCYFWPKLLKITIVMTNNDQ